MLNKKKYFRSKNLEKYILRTVDSNNNTCQTISVKRRKYIKLSTIRDYVQYIRVSQLISRLVDINPTYLRYIVTLLQLHWLSFLFAFSYLVYLDLLLLLIFTPMLLENLIGIYFYTKASFVFISSFSILATL